MSKSDKSKAWWIQEEHRARAFSKTFDNWFREKFDPNSATLKKKHGTDGIIPREKIDKLFEIEKEERMRYAEVLTELDFLGIININTVEIPDWGGGITSQWRYTQFGQGFVRAINRKDQQF